MKNNFKTFISLFLISLLVGCGKDEPSVDPEDLTATINIVSNATLGSILADGKGNTLYFFANDTKETNTCEGGCQDKWPVYYAETMKLGTGLDAADFSETTNSAGEKQTTYKGWPLYYFSPNGDKSLEDPSAIGGEAFNNVWFAAKADYSIMMANAQLVGHDGNNYTNDYMTGDGMTKYFVDGAGRTLYAFIKDYKNTNNFTASDLSNNGVWPIFHTDLAAIPSILTANDFGEIDVFGQKQTTYKGWPLYYFGGNANAAGDENRGENRGISFPAAGVWPVLNTETMMAADAPTVLITEDDEFGNIMTDGSGNTLYFFTRDANGMNNCSGGCANLWPVFYAESLIFKSGSVLSEDDFSEITLDGGSKQTTYKGWPLYYYSPNADGNLEATGDVTGDDFNSVWYVAKESYDLMLANEQLVGHDDVNYMSDYTAGDGLTKYFTDANGLTIYTFKNDAKDTNNFTASDFSNDGVWPIFHVTIDELPSYMDKTEFSEIDVFGRKQLTFKGWPLYYFGQDAMTRGNNKGISFPAAGVWPIANNDLVAAE